MSHARASSQPLPSAYPFTAAMIGLLHPAIASPSRRPISEKARISSADSPAISLMSAPATNALSPAPVRMIAPTSAAIERCSKVIESSRRTDALSAFRASGRSIVTIASRSSISTRTKPGMGSSSGGRMHGMRMNVLRWGPVSSIGPTDTRGPKVECLQTRQRVLAGAIGLLLLAGLLALAGPARANMDRPRWASGDSWTYETGSATSGTSTLSIGVTGTESVLVNGTSYSCYRTLTKLTTTSGSFSITYSADVWFSVDTLVLVKVQASINISGIITVTISGNPPQTIDWPLATGHTSGPSSTVITAETAYPNGTKTYTYQTLSTNFEVLADTSVTVPAGTFTTTPLKETSTANLTYTINYWSPQVGNWAKIGTYDSTGRNQGNYNLTSYSYQGGGFFSSIVLGLPVWIWLILLVVIVVAIVGVFVVRRRKPPAVMPPAMR